MAQENPGDISTGLEVAPSAVQNDDKDLKHDNSPSDGGRTTTSFSLPSLVKPYSPSQEIDWEKVEATGKLTDYHPWRLTFNDPTVQEEFTVFLSRDLIPTIACLFAGVFGVLLLSTDIIYLRPNYWRAIDAVVFAMSFIVFGFDCWAYYHFQPLGEAPAVQGGGGEEREERKDSSMMLLNNNEKTSATTSTLSSSVSSLFFRERVKWAKQRYVCMLLCLVSAQCGLALSNPAYINAEYCRKGTDPFDYMGLRASPVNEYSNQTISDYCGGTASTIVPGTLLSTVVEAASAQPLHFVAVTLLYFSVLILSNFAHPFTAPLEDRPVEDEVLRWIFFVLLVLLAVVMHWFGMKTRLKLFIQQIRLLCANSAAKKRENESGLLLCNILPLTALEQLAGHDTRIVDYASEATVLFSDIKGFTSWSSKRTPEEVVAMLNVLCLEFDLAAEKFSVEKVKTIGDAYWAVSGLPDPCTNHARRVCDLATAMQLAVKKQNKKHLEEWTEAIAIRIGIHSGPLNGAILGKTQLSYEVFGETSDLASKAEQQGIAGKIVMTEATVDFLDPTGLLLDQGLLKECGSIVKKEEETSHLRKDDDGNPASGSSKKDLLLYLANIPTGVSLTAESLQRKKSNATMSSCDPSSVAASSRSVSSFGAEVNQKQIDEIAARRERFRAMKSAQKKEAADYPEELDEATATTSVTVHTTLEAITSRYSQRKFSFLLLDFLDPVVEAEFAQHITETLRIPRTILHAAPLVLLVLALIAVAVSRGSFSEPSAICFAISATFILGDLIVGGIQHHQRSANRSSSSSSSSQDRGAGLLHHHHIQTALSFIGVILLTVAIGMMPTGSSVLTSDVGSHGSLLISFIVIPNVGLVPTILPISLAFVVFAPIFVWLLWDTVLFTVSVSTVPIFLFYWFLSTFVMERWLRNQFLQQHVAAYFRKQQEASNKEQEELLSLMVPHHVVKDLRHWMQAGMDPKKAIVQSFPDRVVGFIQLEWSKDALYSGAAKGMDRERREEQHRQSMSLYQLSLSGSGVYSPHAAAGMPGQVFTSPSPRNSSPATAALHPSNSTPAKGGMSSPAERPMSSASNYCNTSLMQPPASLMAIQDTASSIPQFSSSAPLSLIDAHELVDSILADYQKIVKIKTVGDLVMLAGPFKEEDKEEKKPAAAISAERVAEDAPPPRSPGAVAGAKYTTTPRVTPSGTPRSQALSTSVGGGCRGAQHPSEEILEITTKICTRIPKSRAGLHAGDIVGAVLGNSRLCFDIFGDTVNTTSRVLSASVKQQPKQSGSSSDIFVSSDFFDRYRSSCNKDATAVCDCPSSIVSHNNSYFYRFAKEPILVEAKGKGTLAIYPLESSE